MCYNFNSKNVNEEKVIKDFEAERYHEKFDFINNISAFAKTSSPTIPAVVNNNGIILMNAFWGTKENPDAPTKGKNLQSENTHTYYKKIQNNRCLIPASSYYEHKPITVPGKKTPIKQKFEMFWKNKDQFYIGAFYDFYSDGNIGFGLVTTIPNEVQAEVHHRMIMTFDAKMGREFLDQKPIEEFQFPNYSPDLLAVNLEPEKTANTLF